MADSPVHGSYQSGDLSRHGIAADESGHHDTIHNASTPLAHPRRKLLHRQRSKYCSFSSRAGVALVLLLSLSMILLSAFIVIPSPDELELAREYNFLSTFDAVRKLRSAQLLADTSRLGMMDAVNLRKAMKKITEKGGTRGYVEPPPEGCEATILLMRHCEKGHVREHCSYMGFERSVYLSTLFGDDHERWPAPTFVFAEGPKDRNNKKKMNFREIETVGPLAEKAGVKVDDSYSTKTANKLTRQVLTFLETGQMCGKVTVIAWKHSGIGHVAHHLGCGPRQGCPLDYHGSSFDNVWQIKFTYGKPEHSSHKSLKVPREPEWSVFGSVQPEGFDPLAFSKTAGDYPPGGTGRGARWKKSEVGYPERKNDEATAGWKETSVGFNT